MIHVHNRPIVLLQYWYVTVSMNGYRQVWHQLWCFHLFNLVTNLNVNNNWSEVTIREIYNFSDLYDKLKELCRKGPRGCDWIYTRTIKVWAITSFPFQQRLVYRLYQTRVKQTDRQTNGRAFYEIFFKFYKIFRITYCCILVNLKMGV